MATARSGQRPRSRRNRTLRLAALAVIAVCLVVIVVTLLASGGKPSSAYQQCVSSIKGESSSQVLGYTPACLKLTVAQRNSAIRASGR